MSDQDATTTTPAPETSHVGTSATPLEVDIEINPNASEDSDSTFGDGSSTYTSSISSSILDYKYENGRRYHAYREGKYLFPNDEVEQERLDIVHHVFRLAIGGDILLAPIENPRKALDLGTGTGIWAIEFADQFPEAEILGIDLSAIQPSFVPPNCKFMIDDIEDTWPFHDDEKFDYIHLRCMCGAIGDWAALHAQCLKYLKPGGWLECQEYEAWIYSDDDSMEKATALLQWQTQVDEASAKIGRRMNVATQIGGIMEKAGFTNVTEKVCKIPIGTWAKDPAQKHIGQFQLLNMLEGIEPISLAFFTRVLGHSTEQVQVLLAQVRANLKDPKLHLYGHYRFIYGQKGGEAEAEGKGEGEGEGA